MKTTQIEYNLFKVKVKFQFQLYRILHTAWNAHEYYGLINVPSDIRQTCEWRNVYLYPHTHTHTLLISKDSRKSRSRNFAKNRNLQYSLQLCEFSETFGFSATWIIYHSLLIFLWIYTFFTATGRNYLTNIEWLSVISSVCYFSDSFYWTTCVFILFTCKLLSSNVSLLKYCKKLTIYSEMCALFSCLIFFSNFSAQNRNFSVFPQLFHVKSLLSSFLLQLFENNSATFTSPY